MTNLDYKRIQLILIATFSILNLYLVSVLLEKNKELNFGDPSTAVRLEEGMRNDNIIAPELSNEQINIPIIKADRTNELAENRETLVNQTTRMENNKLMSILSNPIELPVGENVSLEDRLAPIEAFMKTENILKAEEYSFLTYQETNNRIVYVQRADGYPIADGTGSLVFHVNTYGEVVSYEQTYMGMPEVQGKNRTVISEQAAIETLYLNNQIPSNSTLRTITLTYYQTLSLTDMNIYSPMWYVEIVRDDVPIQVKHVDALTGNLISAPSLVDPDGGVEVLDPGIEESNDVDEVMDALQESEEKMLEDSSTEASTEREVIAE